MAGQQIIFEFLSRGSAELAGNFRKVGDDAALSSRGVKILQDVIERLGSKEGRTAAESALLAKALRETGDAADRATAKAVLADAAIRRVGDAMKAVKPADVVILTGKAQAKLAGIQAKAEELRAKFPQFTAQINDRVAKARLDLFAAEAKAKLGALEVKVKVDEPALARAKKALGGLQLNPGLAGPALALAPAIATLGGAAAAAGAGIAGAFVAGGAALAAFGAIAKPVLSGALAAEQAVNAAQNTWQAQAQTGFKNATARAVAYRAEQLAIGKAYADLSPAQVKLSQQLGAMAQAWQNLKAAQTPVVAGALQPWLKSVTDLTGKLGPIIAAVSPVIRSLGVQFDTLVNSPAFKAFRDWVAGTGAAAVSAGGSFVISFVKALMAILPQLDPLVREFTGWLGRMGPALVSWAQSKSTADHIQAFIRFFSASGSVVTGLLKNIGGALKTLAPGLTAGGLTELKIVSDFFGWVAKLPPGIAKPLAEVAGVLLILNKMGVIKAGINLIGLAAGAGPIGLIAIALAAVGTGAFIAWQKSALFRDIIKDIGRVFLEIAIIILAANRNIIVGFLDMVATIVHGAAVAFGWVPGLGGQLREADRAVSGFKNSVSNSFNSLIGTMQAWQKALNASKDTVGTATAAIVKNFQGQGAAALAGRTAVNAYATAVQQYGVTSDAGKGARARLIADLVAAGVNAQTAARLVSGLATALGGLKSKGVTVTMVGSGSFTIVDASGTVHHVGGGTGKAAGGYIAAGTGPAADDVPIWASRGEYVIKAASVAKYGLRMMDAINAERFASGGPVSGNLTPGYVTGMYATFTKDMTDAMVTAMRAAIKAAATAAARTVASSGAGPVSGDAAAAQKYAFSRFGMYGWSPAYDGPALISLWNQESGWNRFAYNASSGATGIPQALPYTKMPRAAWLPSQGGQASMGAQVNWGEDYIKGRYGSPSGAWAHERAFNWYGSGLDAMFSRPTLIGVGERGREHVTVTPEGGRDALVAELRALRAEVRQLTGVAAAIPARTGQHVGDAVSGAGADAAFRRRYPGR